MSNLIKLLPDSVANQIAAGEVVQRPASAVKELLENSIDSGATSVQLIIKDAGKTLIQVIDNGCGMSETDARMCFERHATSKITDTKDLFSIRTKGFRGEAMASIAAVAQVEMKTKMISEELGTKIEIEGSKITVQEPVQTKDGTSIAIKNLFFNIPARRNFLKSIQVETRHIIDEFERVALTHPEVTFQMINNGSETFNLPVGTLRQRIVGVFGKNFNQKLVPLDEKTSIMNLTGFIGKPDFAKKTRGEQFFFVNKRFIKNGYLHFAVMQAYQDLIAHKSYPSYFIYMEIDPASIDINIHPTKTEIKFEDEKAIYAILNSAVKQSIGKYQVAPSLDFEQETSFNVDPPLEGQDIKIPQIKVNPNFNPFDKETSKEKGYSPSFSKPFSKPEPSQIRALDRMYQNNAGISFENLDENPIEDNKLIAVQTEKKIFQVHNRYIYSQLKSGYVLIDQQRAHERILYEKFISSLENQVNFSQQELFPIQIEFSSSNFVLLKEIWEEVKVIGFDISEFGKNTISINGVPADIKETDYQKLFENIIEQFKNNKDQLNLDTKESVARSMARNMSIKKGKQLSEREIIQLTDELFACAQPEYLPNGKRTFITVTLSEIEKQFK
ncbi:MAG: DNA mismatch repair protein MutL [Flavobacteriales bacterium]|jgi:DNA mismatch repair protein MutL|tara:strand:- start:240 stop:2081 length:1842 start_codon:yes stop_codon:yes gene_type:complete